MLSDQEAREQAGVAKQITRATLDQANKMADAEPGVQFTGVLTAAAFQATVMERVGMGMNREMFLETAGELFDSVKQSLPPSLDQVLKAAADRCPCAKCTARREADMAATAAEVPKEEAPSPAADAGAE